MRIKIPSKLGFVRTDVVCLPKGLKIQLINKKQIRGTSEEYPSGIDSKQYDYVGAGMAVSGATIHAFGSFGTSAWPVVAAINGHRRCLTTNGHVSPKKAEKFYQANEQIGKNIGTIYPPDVYPMVSPADFALAELDTARPVYDEIVELGKYEHDYHEPRVGMRVVKRGVTSYGRSGFVTENDVIDGPFDAGPIDYGDGKLGVVGNTYDIVAPSDAPHGGPGCSGSGENESNGSSLLYPAGQLYAGGSDDQGFDHTLFYDWAGKGGPIDRYGITFDLTHFDNPGGDGDGNDGTCQDKAQKCFDKAKTFTDEVNCLIDLFVCVLEQLGYLSTKPKAVFAKRKTTATISIPRIRRRKPK
jgi:hypothetical protein